MSVTVLWTFVANGRDVSQEWANGLRLALAIRARLDQALDRLCQLPFEAVLHTHLLAPMGKHKHILKLRVNGQVAVRILLCRGPLDGETAYTLLVGAVERDWQLEPRDAPEKASSRREQVLAEPTLKRKLHERFGKSIAR